MAHYTIMVYSTAPETACPQGKQHLLEAVIYNREAPRREVTMKRRTASYIAAMARSGDSFFINVLEEGQAVARVVPVAFAQCDCRMGYYLDPWSPHYERPDEALL